MRKLFFTSLVLLVIIFSCNKTEEYVAVPYDCDCGRITWSGLEHSIVGVGGAFMPYDSIALPNQNSRKFDITTDVSEDGELEVHHITSIFEFPEISNVFYHIYADTAIVDTTIIDTTLMQPNITIQEVNFNENVTTYINYKAVDGSLNINVSEDGLSDVVNFNLNIKEVVGNTTIGSFIPYSGTFTYSRE